LRWEILRTASGVARQQTLPRWWISAHFTCFAFPPKSVFVRVHPLFRQAVRDLWFRGPFKTSGRTLRNLGRLETSSARARSSLNFCTQRSARADYFATPRAMSNLGQTLHSLGRSRINGAVLHRYNCGWGTRTETAAAASVQCGRAGPGASAYLGTSVFDGSRFAASPRSRPAGQTCISA